MQHKPVLMAVDVAGLMGCSVKTIEDRARAGDLPGLLWGDGGWRFPAEAFFARLNELAIEQAAKRRQEKTKPAATAAASTQTPSKTKAPPALPTPGGVKPCR